MTEHTPIHTGNHMREKLTPGRAGPPPDQKPDQRWGVSFDASATPATANENQQHQRLANTADRAA